MVDQKNTTNNEYHIRDLLDPENCALMLIDFQPQTAFAVLYQRVLVAQCSFK
jgi:hypothetical protein